MNRVTLGLSALALVAACAGPARAQCDFNTVAKAKGVKTSLVRAFQVCSSTLTGGADINTETGSGIPACEPVLPKPIGPDSTRYLFDPRRGGCDLQAKAKIEKDCALLKDSNGELIGLPAGPCHVTYVKARCDGIVQADEVTPINPVDDAGWSLATLSRVTFNDAAKGDMTVIDFPLTFFFEAPSNGRIKLVSNSAQALATVLVDIDGAALPTCTSVDIVRVSVRDPEGLQFAVIGVSTRAADE